MIIARLGKVQNSIRERQQRRLTLTLALYNQIHSLLREHGGAVCQAFHGPMFTPFRISYLGTALSPALDRP